MIWFVLISYDIVHDRRRAKVATMLENYARRVQFSVFESLMTKQQIDELQGRLRPLIDTTTDSIRIYRLTRDAVTEIRVLGTGQVTALPTVHLY